MIHRFLGPIAGTQGKWVLPPRLIPLVVLAYACLLPRELAVDLAGANLFPYRLVLIAVLPFALARLVRERLSPSYVDVFAAFTAVWFIITLYYSTSPDAAFITGSALCIDYLFAYLVGRVSVRSAQDVRVLMAWLLPALVLVGVSLMIESITHRAILRPLAASLTGRSYPEIYENVRWGLSRASGPFPHPILGGVFLAGLLAPLWLALGTLKQRLIGVAAALSLVFTVSATAFLALAVSGGLLLAYILQRLLRVPVLPVMAFYFSCALTGIALLSENGIASFVTRRLTLNTGSGYYRQFIWQYAGAEVERHPIFGIGMRDWVRPAWMPSDSVDSYWLVLALFYGIPAAVGSFLVISGSIGAAVGAHRRLPLRDKQIAAALAISLFASLFAGLSVHIWEGLHTWLIMICGICVSLNSQFREKRAANPYLPPVMGLTSPPGYRDA